MNAFSRAELIVIVKYLSQVEKYKKSIAPRSAIAYDLKAELAAAGIPSEDHTLFVGNHCVE
jgi:hypothetical protein